MKRKELKNLAEKIAKCEYVIQNSSDEDAVQASQEEPMRLSSRVHDLQDSDTIDEMVQDILNKMS